MTTTERDMLTDERQALLDRLVRVDLVSEGLGVLERALERRALRQRIDEIDALLTATVR